VGWFYQTSWLRQPTNVRNLARKAKPFFDLGPILRSFIIFEQHIENFGGNLRFWLLYGELLFNTSAAAVDNSSCYPQQLQ